MKLDLMHAEILFALEKNWKDKRNEYGDKADYNSIGKTLASFDDLIYNDIEPNKKAPCFRRSPKTYRFKYFSSISLLCALKSSNALFCISHILLLSTSSNSFFTLNEASAWL